MLACRRVLRRVLTVAMETPIPPVPVRRRRGERRPEAGMDVTAILPHRLRNRHL